MLRTGDILAYRTVYIKEVGLILGKYKDKYLYCDLSDYHNKVKDKKNELFCQCIMLDNITRLKKLDIGHDEKVKIDILKRALHDDYIVISVRSAWSARLGYRYERKELKFKDIEIIE